MATSTHALINGAATTLDDYGLPGDPAWTEIDWREHLHSADVMGTRVNYVDVGEGPPVVLVHGLSGCWQNWLENIPHLAQRHRVIIPDLPGFGRSPMPPEPITIPYYGHFLNALLDHLDLDRASVVGNSMGGFVSAEVAVSHRSRIDALVLVSAVGVHKLPRNMTPGQAVRAAGWMRPVTDATLRRADFLVRRARGRRLLLGMVARYPERLQPQMCVEMLMGADKPGFADALHSIFNYDLRHRLEDVTVPALIVWGRNDMLVPVESAHTYERHLPNSTKVILDGTGHVAMIERARTFNRLVGEFLPYTA